MVVARNERQYLPSSITEGAELEMIMLKEMGMENWRSTLVGKERN